MAGAADVSVSEHYFIEFTGHFRPVTYKRGDLQHRWHNAVIAPTCARLQAGRGTTLEGDMDGC